MLYLSTCTYYVIPMAVSPREFVVIDTGILNIICGEVKKHLLKVKSLLLHYGYFATYDFEFVASKRIIIPPNKQIKLNTKLYYLCCEITSRVDNCN